MASIWVPWAYRPAYHLPPRYIGYGPVWSGPYHPSVWIDGAIPPARAAEGAVIDYGRIGLEWMALSFIAAMFFLLSHKEGGLGHTISANLSLHEAEGWRRIQRIKKKQDDTLVPMAQPSLEDVVLAAEC